MDFVYVNNPGIGTQANGVLPIPIYLNGPSNGGPTYSSFDAQLPEYSNLGYVQPEEQFATTAVKFDTYEELIWTANNVGHIKSYYSSNLQRYTSFKVNNNEVVRDMVITNGGVLALDENSLRYQLRRGIPQCTHTSVNMCDMLCMAEVSPERLILCGQTENIIDLDLVTFEETRVVSSPSGAAVVRKHPQFLCTGSVDGRITIRDLNTLNVQHAITTNTITLFDFDVQGNYLISCGLSNNYNRQGAYAYDRSLMVYDIRMMRVVTPIQTAIDPVMLRFLPNQTARLAVVSPTGQLQLVDTIALSVPRLHLYQVNLCSSQCMAFDVSSTNQAIAFGDQTGRLSLLNKAITPMPIFNAYSRPTEFADAVRTSPYVSVTETRATGAFVPLPVLTTGEYFMSDFPLQYIQYRCRIPMPIDAQVLSNMRMQGPIGYAHNSQLMTRNMVPYMSPVVTNNRSASPANSTNKYLNGIQKIIPKIYKKLEIKYNKAGYHDFDVESCNKTKFVALETNLPNSYCNPMLQILYFMSPLRKTIQMHTCDKEFCLTCELGFLFDMLDNATTPCQASNFLRSFRTVPEAHALGLILSDHQPNTSVHIANLIQSWNRFILYQMHNEIVGTRRLSTPNDVPEIVEITSNVNEVSEITKLFGTRIGTIYTCCRCKQTTVKSTQSLEFKLQYPEEWTDEKISFGQILTDSLYNERIIHSWCEECSVFINTTLKNKITSLPNAFALNCGLSRTKEKIFWRQQTNQNAVPTTARVHSNSTVTHGKLCRYGSSCVRPDCHFYHPDRQPTTEEVVVEEEIIDAYQSTKAIRNWFPSSFTVALENETGNIKIKTSLDDDYDAEDSDEEDAGAAALDDNKKLYNLTAMVCTVNDGKQKNLVALIDVKDNYYALKNKEDTNGDDGSNRWYLFNDFIVTPIPTEEALCFTFDWKVPSILIYTYAGVENEPVEKIRRNLPNINPFHSDPIQSVENMALRPLDENDIIKPGYLIGIDAEFVTLFKEENEINSDGSTSKVKLCHQSVARITCIRGQAPYEGFVFMDDYISTQEEIVDYLTEYSGIMPGDLDATRSEKRLTTLKKSYQKLRYLVDNGCIFVGHGLNNDFRVINMFVPPEQIIDTVKLYHLPHQRMISLRFLAWHFLRINIQTKVHDSIEDSLAAQNLYKHYLKLHSEGMIDQALQRLYEVGQIMSWKVVGDE